MMGIGSSGGIHGGVGGFGAPHPPPVFSPPAMSRRLSALTRPVSRNVLLRLLDSWFIPSSQELPQPMLFKYRLITFVSALTVFLGSLSTLLVVARDAEYELSENAFSHTVTMMLSILPLGGSLLYLRLRGVMFGTLRVPLGVVRSRTSGGSYSITAPVFGPRDCVPSFTVHWRYAPYVTLVCVFLFQTIIQGGLLATKASESTELLVLGGRMVFSVVPVLAFYFLGALPGLLWIFCAGAANVYVTITNSLESGPLMAWLYFSVIVLLLGWLLLTHAKSMAEHALRVEGTGSTSRVREMVSGAGGFGGPNMNSSTMKEYKRTVLRSYQSMGSYINHSLNLVKREYSDVVKFITDDTARNECQSGIRKTIALFNTMEVRVTDMAECGDVGETRITRSRVRFLDVVSSVTSRFLYSNFPVSLYSLISTNIPEEMMVDSKKVARIISTFLLMAGSDAPSGTCVQLSVAVVSHMPQHGIPTVPTTSISEGGITRGGAGGRSHHQQGVSNSMGPSMSRVMNGGHSQPHSSGYGRSYGSVSSGGGPRNFSIGGAPKPHNNNSAPPNSTRIGGGTGYSPRRPRVLAMNMLEDGTIDTSRYIPREEGAYVFAKNGKVVPPSSDSAAQTTTHLPMSLVDRFGDHPSLVDPFVRGLSKSPPDALGTSYLEYRDWKFGTWLQSNTQVTRQGFMCVEIAYPGNGFAPQELAKFFTPGGLPARFQEQVGTFALPLAMKYINNCDGELHVVTSRAQGTRFRVFLPFTYQNPGNNLRASSAQQQQPPASPVPSNHSSHGPSSPYGEQRPTSGAGGEQKRRSGEFRLPAQQQPQTQGPTLASTSTNQLLWNGIGEIMGAPQEHDPDVVAVTPRRMGKEAKGGSGGGVRAPGKPGNPANYTPPTVVELQEIHARVPRRSSGSRKRRSGGSSGGWSAVVGPTPGNGDGSSPQGTPRFFEAIDEAPATPGPQILPGPPPLSSRRSNAEFGDRNRNRSSSSASRSSSSTNSPALYSGIESSESEMSELYDDPLSLGGGTIGGSGGLMTMDSTRVFPPHPHHHHHHSRSGSGVMVMEGRRGASPAPDGGFLGSSILDHPRAQSAPSSPIMTPLPAADPVVRRRHSGSSRRGGPPPPVVRMMGGSRGSPEASVSEARVVVERSPSPVPPLHPPSSLPAGGGCGDPAGGTMASTVGEVATTPINSSGDHGSDSSSVGAGSGMNSGSTTPVVVVAPGRSPSPALRSQSGGPGTRRSGSAGIHFPPRFPHHFHHHNRPFGVSGLQTSRSTANSSPVLPGPPELQVTSPMLSVADVDLESGGGGFSPRDNPLPPPPPLPESPQLSSESDDTPVSPEGGGSEDMV